MYDKKVKGQKIKKLKYNLIEKFNWFYITNIQIQEMEFSTVLKFAFFPVY